MLSLVFFLFSDSELRIMLVSSKLDLMKISHVIF